jgi:hypothetical protein
MLSVNVKLAVAGQIDLLYVLAVPTTVLPIFHWYEVAVQPETVAVHVLVRQPGPLKYS